MEKGTVIRCVWEHRGEDTLLWAEDFPGAFARGADLAEAVEKLPRDLSDWSDWTGAALEECSGVVIVSEVISGLDIRDADSDVLMASEREPLSRAEYETLRDMALRSAERFQALYDSVPDPDRSANPVRQTFYGAVPRTAREMYEHTKNVNAYYFGEIGVEADNEGILSIVAAGALKRWKSSRISWKIPSSRAAGTSRGPCASSCAASSGTTGSTPELWYG